MDKRKRLVSGAALSFPEMECRVESLAGCGSQVMAYLGSYADPLWPQIRRRVLIQELFPYHPQNQVYRDEAGDICWETEAKELMEVHLREFYRENQIGRGLENVGSARAVFSLNHTLYSVLEFTGGRSLEEEMGRPGAANVSLAAHIRRICGVLDSLESFHKLGLLHLDINPDTILLLGEGEKEQVVLAAFNGVHTKQEMERGEFLYRRGRECYTAPEVRLGDVENIGYASDLYAVSSVFYQCLTGKKLSVLQMLQNRAPEVSEARSLDDMPGAARVMTRKILKRGLSCLAHKRYPCTGAMRRDLEELKALTGGIHDFDGLGKVYGR